MRVDDGSDDLVAVAGHRRSWARQVIVATGAFGLAVPAAGQLDTSIRQLHSSEYCNPRSSPTDRSSSSAWATPGADIAYETAATHRTFLSGASHGELLFRVLDTWRARLIPPILGLEDHVITIRTPMGRRAASRSRGRQLRSSESAGFELDQAGVVRHEARPASARDGKPASTTARSSTSGTSPGDGPCARLCLDRAAGRRRRRLAHRGPRRVGGGRPLLRRHPVPVRARVDPHHGAAKDAEIRRRPDRRAGRGDCSATPRTA